MVLVLFNVSFVDIIQLNILGGLDFDFFFEDSILRLVLLQIVLPFRNVRPVKGQLRFSISVLELVYFILRVVIRLKIGSSAQLGRIQGGIRKPLPVLIC